MTFAHHADFDIRRRIPVRQHRSYALRRDFLPFGIYARRLADGEMHITGFPTESQHDIVRLPVARALQMNRVSGAAFQSLFLKTRVYNESRGFGRFAILSVTGCGKSRCEQNQDICPQYVIKTFIHFHTQFPYVSQSAPDSISLAVRIFSRLLKVLIVNKDNPQG